MAERAIHGSRADIASARARLPSRALTLAGAAWGATSALAIAFPRVYFGVLGYPLGRVLRWTMPAWYSVLAIARAGSASIVWPPWLFGATLVVLAILIGAAVGLLLAAFTRLGAAFLGRQRA